MLKNHFIIAWRNLLRNKLYTVINTLGLAIGISACLVIFLIAYYEFSFNRQVPGNQEIYRVHSSFTGVFTGKNRGVANAMPAWLQENLAGRAEVVPFHTFSADVTIPAKTGEPNVIKSQRSIILAGPEYFTVFPIYTWIVGTPKMSLSKPFQVVLTESKAKTYFGNIPLESIVGRNIAYRDSLNLTVSGIVKDVTIHTDLTFTDFISITTINASWLAKNKNLTDWQSTNSSSQCFVKASDLQAVQTQLANAGKRYEEFNKEREFRAHYELQPLNDLHFNPDLGIFDGSDRGPAHKPTLLVLTIVAILLLAIAAINFINLETAQAIKRAREVGIRKVMGSSRLRLMLQFLLQSFLVTLCAVILAVPLAETAVNTFHEFIPAGMKFRLDTVTVTFLLAVTGIVGILSGLYPAFVMSSFQPVKALKNNGYVAGGTVRTAYLRKALIVFQFTIAQVLIVGTLIVVAQIRFMLNKDLGFEKDAVVSFYAPWQADAKLLPVLKNKLGQIPGIQDLTLCMAPPSASGYSSSVFKFNNGTEVLETNVYRKFGDTNYIPFYKLKLLAGRNITQSDTTREFVINETYMKFLGYQDPQKILGQEMEIDSIRYPIVGVVKDFHTQSLHNALQPICISTEKENMGMISLKLDPHQNMQQNLAAVEESWKQIYPGHKFEYMFLDEAIARFYESEQRVSKLMSMATAIAIILSCLGLFGLASYAATQRTREIGIRKVLGATVNTIVVMLSKDFVKLVLIAFVLAVPVSYLIADHWLKDFAFRVSISAWLFIVAAAGAVVIALLTVSYHAIRAALANPADSLRSE